jgi:HK97 gp10 family phage protein
MVSIKFDIKALTAGLEQFASDIQDHAVRSAAFAASKVLYEEMRLRAPRGKTGNLQASIYQHHDDKSANGVHIYAIGPNKKRGKGNHWHLIEYGHWRTNVVIKLPNGQFMATKTKLETPVWVPAKPFIRPTYDAKINQAIDAAKQRLFDKVKELSDDA